MVLRSSKLTFFLIREHTLITYALFWLIVTPSPFVRTMYTIGVTTCYFEIFEGLVTAKTASEGYFKTKILPQTSIQREKFRSKILTQTTDIPKNRCSPAFLIIFLTVGVFFFEGNLTFDSVFIYNLVDKPILQVSQIALQIHNNEYLGKKSCRRIEAV